MIKLLTTPEQFEGKPTTLPFVHDALVAHALMLAIEYHKCEITPAGPIYSYNDNGKATCIGIAECESDNAHTIYETAERILKNKFNIEFKLM